MKKNIFKKIFIKISKILGYEIIDQNEFYSPTLEKSVDENLSNLNKSIALAIVRNGKKLKGTKLFVPMKDKTINVEVTDTVFLDKENNRLNVKL